MGMVSFVFIDSSSQINRHTYSIEIFPKLTIGKTENPNPLMFKITGAVFVINFSRFFKMLAAIQFYC